MRVQQSTPKYWLTTSLYRSTEVMGFRLITNTWWYIWWRLWLKQPVAREGRHRKSLSDSNMEVVHRHHYVFTDSYKLLASDLTDQRNDITVKSQASWNKINRFLQLFLQQLKPEHKRMHKLTQRLFPLTSKVRQIHYILEREKKIQQQLFGKHTKATVPNASL